MRPYRARARAAFWENVETREVTTRVDSMAADAAADGLERCSSCYIPTSWLALPLLSRREYNHDSTVFTFGLPEGQSLSLPVCACVLLRAPGKGRKDGGGPDDFDGSDAVRPYTPISDNSMLGQFELLIKRYDGGAVSQYLFGLKAGEAQVEFKVPCGVPRSRRPRARRRRAPTQPCTPVSRVAQHIKFNIKAQYPFDGKATFTMLCGGTGIAPIYQALWKLLGTEGDERKVTLIFSNKTEQDILLKDELDAYGMHPRSCREPSVGMDKARSRAGPHLQLRRRIALPESALARRSRPTDWSTSPALCAYVRSSQIPAPLQVGLRRRRHA